MRNLNYSIIFFLRIKTLTSIFKSGEGIYVLEFIGKFT